MRWCHNPPPPRNRNGGPTQRLCGSLRVARSRLTPPTAKAPTLQGSDPSTQGKSPQLHGSARSGAVLTSPGVRSMGGGCLSFSLPGSGPSPAPLAFAQLFTAATLPALPVTSRQLGAVALDRSCLRQGLTGRHTCAKSHTAKSPSAGGLYVMRGMRGFWDKALAASINFSSLLTKIHDAAVLAHRFCFSQTGGGGVGDGGAL